LADSECRRKGPKIAVVGMGNLLLKDEGIGVHVAQALQEMAPENGSNLQIVDGGTSPDVLLSLDKVDKLIIIDAVKGDCEPGTIYRLGPDEIPENGAEATSLHQVGLMQSLQILDKFGLKPPKVVIVGIQPKEIDWGTEPSAELGQKIPEMMRLVLEEARKC